MSNDPERLTVPEAGRRFFGASKDRSYALVDEGFIPAIRVGRKLLVPAVAMEQRYAELTEQALSAARKAA